MRILRIYTRIPPCKGGMEKHIYHLTKGQIDLRHDVTVFFNKGNKISENDIQISTIPLYKTKPRALGMIIFHFLIVLKLLFKKEQFDVVHIHGDWSSLIFAKVIKHLTNSKKIAFSIHDDIKDSFLYKQIFSLLLKQVDMIFSTGFNTAEKLKIFTSKKVIFQPSGVDDIFFEPYEKKFNKERLQVITVANLVPKKNLDLVLDIAKEVNKMDFIIVGDGPLKNHLQNRIINENIINLKLLGYKNKYEIRDLYRQSDIFLLTSFKEGTSTALLEAITCGLTIISSNAGRLDKVLIYGKNGFIINIKATKEQYINLLLPLDIMKRQEIFAENIAHSINYRWCNIVKRFY